MNSKLGIDKVGIGLQDETEDTTTKETPPSSAYWQLVIFAMLSAYWQFVIFAMLSVIGGKQPPSSPSWFM